ncbi:MAG: endonuclease/exonuclease/phosphatase family protein [Prevotella sp.]|nr:endonuclease/exonuclease/phosphatase family protein [Prevotella sp.]
MGKLAVYKYVAMMFLVLQLIVSAYTFLGLFGGDVNPAGNMARAMVVYILPVLIVANFLLLIYWLVRKRWFIAILPFVTILCCIPYMGTVIQLGSVNEKAADAQEGLKIATYNVARFNRETSGFLAQDILAEMKRQKVDVFCIQEYMETSGDVKNTTSYKEYFPYVAMAGRDVVIFSRYPIKKSKPFLFEDSNQAGMYADINVKGQTIRVFSVHLESTGINRTVYKAGKLEAQGYDVSTNRVLNAIYGNYSLGMMFRAAQANIIANEIRSSEIPCIVCGDFNDVPYSYVYKTMLGNLVDGFKECGGDGWMGTYRGKKNVRIDYIFHSESLKGLEYHKTKLTYSDHYPVFMKVALQ